MEKKIRNAVRVYIKEDDKVVCIQYKEGPIGYIDMPGGKIEQGETAYEAAIREVKEETGMRVEKLEKIGTVIEEYPDRIYHFQVFMALDFSGNPQEFVENSSFWISISELKKKEKRFGIAYLLNSEYEDDFRNKTLNYKIDVEMNNTILKIERM